MIRKFIWALLHNPWRIVFAIARRVPHSFSDAFYVKLMYRASLGRWPNLQNPKRFTEKLQWLKLHDRNPLYTTLVDKLAVKDYVSRELGDEYIFKTLEAWSQASDIDFNSLPGKFVLKCNHYGGGAVFICKDREAFDFDGARRGLERQLNSGIYWTTREWPYKNVPKKVFAEEYMEDDSGSLRDYKFYCINGEPQFVLVVSDRYGEHRYDGYDMDFKPFGRVSNVAEPSERPMQKPKAFDEMVRIAKKLSAGFKFVRVDLYEVKGRVYFGEFTFYPASGLNNRGSDEWDLAFGKELKLS